MTTTNHARRTRPHAFSLLEMLVVIAIIGLLAALILPNIGSAFGSSQRQTAEAQLRQLLGAVEEFRRDMGRLPTEEEGLDALVTMPEDGEDKWSGYLDRRTIPADPWGNPYVYEKLPDDPMFDFTILSLGSDGQRGGEGDAQDIDARD